MLKIDRLVLVSFIVLITFVLIHQLVLFNAINELNWDLLYLEYLDLFLSEIVYFFHLFLIGYSIYNFFKNKRIKYFFSLVALLLITGLYFPIQYYYDQDAIDKFAERQKLEQTNPTNGD
jgi:Zn-dependent protease with chaperone function